MVIGQLAEQQLAFP